MTTAASISSIDGVRNQCVASAEQIRDTLTIYRSRWSIWKMPLNTVHFATIALLTLLKEGDSMDNYKAPIDLCIILRALARRWQLAKRMLRDVVVTSEQMQTTLPQETQILFRDLGP